jgi:hypothetical protein
MSAVQATSCDIEATREASVELRGVKPSPEEQIPCSVIGASGCEQGVDARGLSDACVFKGGELGGLITKTCGEPLVEGVGSSGGW